MHVGAVVIPKVPLFVTCGMFVPNQGTKGISYIWFIQDNSDSPYPDLRGFRACLQHWALLALVWSKVLIDRDPHCYTRRVKEVIHIRLHPNNINRDSGIEIPEAWMSTVKIETQQQESRVTEDHRGNKSPKQRGSKCANHSCWKPTNHSRASCFIRWRMTSQPHCLKKTTVKMSRSTSQVITSRDVSYDFPYSGDTSAWFPAILGSRLSS